MGKLVKSISLLGIGFLAGLATAYMVGLLDPDRNYKIGNDKIGFFEMSASASSPFAKCKQQMSELEADVSDKSKDLSRVSGEIFQLKKKLMTRRSSSRRKGLFGFHMLRMCPDV